jgi:hypothetical protein
MGIMIVAYSNQYPTISKHQIQQIVDDILDYIADIFKPVDHKEILTEVGRVYAILLDLYDYPDSFEEIDFILALAEIKTEVPFKLFSSQSYIRTTDE